MADPLTWKNETRHLGDLIPWPRNPRKIDGDQAKRLAESFEEFGQVETIAIGPVNEVYNGHQRLKVLASKFGKDHEVEVRVSSRPLSEKEREKLTVFLPKGAAGDWDWESLTSNFEVGDLLEWGFSEKDLQLGGFDLNHPDGDDPGAQIDKAEELRVKWGVQSGQLWRLGEHRLICGDCTEKSVVERLMQGEKAGAVVTDPPYNVGIEYGSGVNDAKTVEENEKFISKWFTVWKDVRLKIVTPGAGYYLGTLRSWLTIFPPTWMCLWLRKNSMSHSPLRGFAAWEPVLFYDIEEGEQDWGGILIYGKVKKPVGQDIFDIPVRVQPEVADDAGNKLHPTPKPIELFDALVAKFTNKGDVIAEPFLGSGTTLIACERLNRKCRAIEISPAYCAVAIERWQVMTGGTPEMVV